MVLLRVSLCGLVFTTELITWQPLLHVIAAELGVDVLRQQRLRAQQTEGLHVCVRVSGMDDRAVVS